MTRSCKVRGVHEVAPEVFECDAKVPHPTVASWVAVKVRSNSKRTAKETANKITRALNGGSLDIPPATIGKVSQPGDRARRVVCAAIRGANGHFLVGVRHYSPDMLATIAALAHPEEFHHRHGDDQGFIDNFGAYLTRREAHDLALASGQIEHDLGGSILYSEDLY